MNELKETNMNEEKIDLEPKIEPKVEPKEPMTDRNCLMQLINSLGLKQVYNIPDLQEYWVQEDSVTISSGLTSGRYIKFSFHNGKLQSYGVYKA